MKEMPEKIYKIIDKICEEGIGEKVIHLYPHELLPSIFIPESRRDAKVYQNDIIRSFLNGSDTLNFLGQHEKVSFLFFYQF